MSHSARRVGALALLGALVALPPGSPGSPRPAAAADQPPNLILVLTDDQPFDAVPHTPPVMPWLEGRVADPADHWVRFPNAFTNTSLCCPARATLLTGRYSHHHGVQTNQWRGIFDPANTLATWLDGAGYRTGLFGKYLNGYTRPADGAPPPGWDRWFAYNGSSNGLYYDYDVHHQSSLVHFGTSAADYSTDVYAAEALDFVETTPTSEPFFMWFSPSAPHEPPVPAPRHASLPAVPIVHSPNFNEQDVSDKPAWVRGRQALSASGVVAEDAQKQDAYRTLRAVDEAMQDLYDAVAARGQLDNTVFVFLTDNGFSMKEHRWHGKRCGYDSCTHTPLFVRVPGIAGNRTVTPIVSNVSVASTLAELAGVAPGLPQDGGSVMPLIQETAPPWPSTILMRWAGDGSTVPPYWGARSLSYLYLEYQTTERELYDLTEDPWLLQNRAGDPAYASVQSQMASTLDGLRGGEPDPPSDSVPPAITITTPGAGAEYAQGSTVKASYACSDTGGSGIATCTGPVPNGGALDTSTTGPKTFTVDATDRAGNPATLTRTYQVGTGGGGGTHSLTVTRSGRGSVRSSDSLINCGRDCTQTYAAPTAVTLRARPPDGWVFSGWGGGVPASCTTQVRCDLTVSGTVQVTATFTVVGGAGSASGRPLP